MSNTFESRINKIIGQLESLKNELSKERYDCEYVVGQIKVIVGAVKSLGVKVAEEDIEKCLHEELNGSKQKETLKAIIRTVFK